MKKELKITGNFDFLDGAHSFVSGADARAVYDYMLETFGKGVWYDEESRTMQGSNFPIAARLDSLLKEKNLGIRVATLADLISPEVQRMIEGKNYADTSSLILRTEEDDYKRNNPLIKKLLPLIEKKQGKLKLPVKITGLNVIPAENDYGWTVSPRDDFNVVHSDRLKPEYRGWIFSTLDENDLPIFNENGKLTWCASHEGLLRLYAGIGRSVGSDSAYLASSYEYGRVVLVVANPLTKKR